MVIRITLILMLQMVLRSRYPQMVHGLMTVGLISIMVVFGCITKKWQVILSVVMVFRILVFDQVVVVLKILWLLRDIVLFFAAYQKALMKQKPLRQVLALNGLMAAQVMILFWAQIVQMCLKVVLVTIPLRVVLEMMSSLEMRVAPTLLYSRVIQRIIVCNGMVITKIQHCE